MGRTRRLVVWLIGFVVAMALVTTVVFVLTRSSPPSDISMGVAAERQAVKDANVIQGDVAIEDFATLAKSLTKLTNLSGTLTASEKSSNAQYDRYAAELVREYHIYYVNVVTYVFSPSESLIPVINRDIAKCNVLDAKIDALVKKLK